MSIFNTLSDHSKDHLALLGKFIVTYEELNSWTFLIIPMIVFNKPFEEITNQEKNKISTLLVNTGASDLREMMLSLIYDNLEPNREVEENLKLFKKITNDLPSLRNEIAHGHYDLSSVINTDGAGEIKIRHYKNTKQGLRTSPSIYNLNDLHKITKSMDNLLDFYLALATYVNSTFTKIGEQNSIKYMEFCLKRIDEKSFCRKGN